MSAQPQSRAVLRFTLRFLGSLLPQCLTPGVLRANQMNISSSCELCQAGDFPAAWQLSTAQFIRMFWMEDLLTKGLKQASFYVCGHSVCPVLCIAHRDNKWLGLCSVQPALGHPKKARLSRVL